MERLSQITESHLKTIQNQNSIIQKQHDSILKYENDLLFKSKKELIIELICIADQVRLTIADQVAEKSYDRIYQSLEDLVEWIDGTLQNETVKKFEIAKFNNRNFDASKQEVIDIQETGDINEDGCVKTINPGYYWTLPLVGSASINASTSPQKFEFVLRPEQVVKLKYNPGLDKKNSLPQKSTLKENNGSSEGSLNKEEIIPQKEEISKESGLLVENQEVQPNEEKESETRIIFEPSKDEKQVKSAINLSSGGRFSGTSDTKIFPHAIPIKDGNEEIEAEAIRGTSPIDKTERYLDIDNKFQERSSTDVAIEESDSAEDVKGRKELSSSRLQKGKSEQKNLNTKKHSKRK